MDEMDVESAVARGGGAPRPSGPPKGSTALKSCLVVLLIMCVVLSGMLAHVTFSRTHHASSAGDAGGAARTGVLMRAAGGNLITTDPVPAQLSLADRSGAATARGASENRKATAVVSVSPSPPPQPPPPSPPPAPVVAAKRAKHKAILDVTVDSLRPYTKNNLIIVTWGNHYYLDFVTTWVWHLESLGVTNFIVGAMDSEMMAALEARGIPSFAMNLDSLTTKDFGWGSPTFHKMGRQKIALVHKFVSLGLDLLLSDVDVLYMRNPSEFIARYPTAEILTSSDHLSSTTPPGDEGLEHYPQAGGPFNIGIMFFRATQPVKEMAVEWSDSIEKDPNLWDQNAFNNIIRKGHPKVDRSTRLFTGYNEKVQVGVLPVSLFGSGHAFFVQRMHEAKRVQPFAVHATFQFCGTEGKRHRMREFMLWREEPEYWDPPGGLIVYEPEVPRSLIEAGARGYNGKLDSVGAHFKLVNFQLRQMRDAMAIATSLGRTLVMPKLWCGLDRVWFPHSGVFPGSQLKLPFVCPLDHVLEVNVMMEDRDEAFFGPKIGFREYSFLENPQLPAAVRGSQVAIDVCPKGSGSGSGASCGPSPVALPAGLNDGELRAFFRPHAGTKVLRLTSLPEGVFGGFAEARRGQQFLERLKHYGGPWGQVQHRPGGAGHIWYDLWWDRAPHRDRFGRNRVGAWRPITGDGGRQGGFE